MGIRRGFPAYTARLEIRGMLLYFKAVIIEARMQTQIQTQIAGRP